MSFLACFLALACTELGSLAGPEETTTNSLTVSSVEMTPSELTVEVDGTASLSLEVRTDDGEPLDRDGEWTVENPDFVQVQGEDARRQVKGLAEGTTRVIGTVDGVADTAAVEVIAATAPGDVEPVFEDGFDGGTLASAQNGYEWKDGWKFDVSSNAGRGGLGGLVLTYPGQPDGSDSKPQMNLDFGEKVEEVWVEYWMKVPSNYLHRDQDAGSTNNKFFGVWRAGRVEPKIVPELQRVDPVGDGDREESWVKFGESGDPMISEFGGTYQDAFDHPYIAKADHGDWIRIRWHLRVGDTDGRGGAIVELWKDGMLFHSDFDADGQFNEDPDLNHFSQMRLLGWSNSGFDEETPFVFDDVRIYTADPGW